MALTFQQMQNLTNTIAGNIAPQFTKPIPMSPSTLLHGADENSIRYAVRQDALAHPENYQPNAQPVSTVSMVNDPTQYAADKKYRQPQNHHLSGHHPW